jgi:hypothetical protein
MGLCKRAKTLCYSGRLAPSPDAGSLPLLLMIMKLVCVIILNMLLNLHYHFQNVIILNSLIAVIKNVENHSY